MKTPCVFPLAATLFLATALQAFNPPTDTQQKVTLSIDGVAEKVGPDRWAVRKVPTDQPFTFTVRLHNASDKPVSGTVAVAINDDWQVTGTNAFLVSVAPGQTWQTTCTATACNRVLDALYPIHARFSLNQAELHPIAIFQAERPAAATAPAPLHNPTLTPGVWRLSRFTPTATAWRRGGKTAALPYGFNGSDRESGATWVREEMVRGGVLRQCLSIHPPWKGGHGTLWSDYRLTLPANAPVALNFHTAIRDTLEEEPTSDGVAFRVLALDAAGKERELFSRFSDAKIWQPAEIDLSAYAGQTVTLRLWNGPGPKNDTTCDNGFWGDPSLLVGAMPPPVTEAEWQDRTATACRLAKDAWACKPKTPGVFQLTSDRERYGAAVVLGKEGLADAVIAFSDGTRAVAFRGFTVEVEGQTLGAVRDGQPVQSVETSHLGAEWSIVHQVAAPLRASASPRETLPVRATLRADHGVLRVAWDMPGTVRDARGNPCFTKLALGPSDSKPSRIYLGFGAVYDEPGAFTLPYGGVQLGTRHIGADYAGGLSLVQATDLLPDRVACVPSEKLFSLETPHDACFLFAPSAFGAYAAARTYRDVCGFEKARGVDGLLGRVCLDQWGGDYRVAAKDIDRAAKYGLTHTVFVKHDWQRWGYDYRLPEIYPPAGGLEPFREIREAARRAGMLFAPHDNYIDFYPDAEGFSYDHIAFHADGAPHPAWYHPGRDAQSYRWRPDAFTPWLSANMRRMREGFDPDALFIDVFTSLAPFDFYDRGGAFHTRAETVKGWRAAFDTSRSLLGHDAAMISESGHDALIGSVDGVQADHWRPDCWLKTYKDADRTPWHDRVTHGKMVLFAGGLGHRYDDTEGHGYGSDDYLSNTVLGGRGPMCDGPFSRRAVMTYWLLHDVCDALARAEMETHSFGASVRQQHTTFSKGGRVWANRGTNAWNVADNRILPEYGFYVQTRKAEAGVVLLNGHRAGFAQSEDAFFADARPQPDPEPGCRVETRVLSAERLSPRAYRVTVEWNVLAPLEPGYVPFVHIGRAATGKDERIEAQANLAFDLHQLTQTGLFRSSMEVSLPADFAPGDYFVRYGLFHRKNGDRLPLRGLEDRQRRMRGGVLRITPSGDEYLVQEPLPDSPDLNLAGALLDFGPVLTDGAFRLLHADRAAWQLIPLPASRPFRADIRLSSLGAKRATVKAVERVDPFYAFAKQPEWNQDGDTLHLACDALSFGYRIVFE
jgi:hypothetical protein